MTSHVLLGIVFSLETNIPSKQKCELRGSIEECGGIINDFITKKVFEIHNFQNNITSKSNIKCFFISVNFN